jgi:hypothetical protein
MTSENSKKKRLHARRLQRAKVLAAIDTPHVAPPPGAVMADPTELAHNNTYGRLPRFYVDRVFQCRQCEVEEVGLAGRQKWWYEVAKGNINTEAVLCRAKEKIRKEAAMQTHLKGLAKKHGLDKK